MTSISFRSTLALLIAVFALASCSSNPSSSDPGDAPSVDVVDEDASTDADTGADAPACDDPDNDLYGPGCALGEDDCQPLDRTSNPGATERCGDLVDNDCDGEVDEECPCSEGRIEPCYDGPAGTEGVGECSAGYRTCQGGEWGACEGDTVPRDDESLCDGVDEDCDGEVDEGLANACGTCGALPLEECGDGLDNDCDGVIDEADAGCDCDGRERQVCYSGIPRTLGVGRCAGGLTDCGDDGQWGACIGELLPIAEICDDIDNDCDGRVDEGLRNACGVCGAPDPVEVCDGEDNDCDGSVDEGLRLACGACPGEVVDDEVCGDGLDNDCDGVADQGCACVGESSCYPGPPATRGVGACAAGSRTCDATGEFWGACSGFVLPTIEVCDGVDNDCDGQVDIGPNGCSVCGGDLEICDGEDNDCDGREDEGVRNSCGVCIVDVVPEAICDGEDNDCDGFVDEALTNACGTCGDSCYVGRWDDPSDWADGDFEGLDDENLDDGLRLGSRRSAFPDLWVANSPDRTVTRIDTDTASVVGTYPVGIDPSRTAVDFEGTVFVANRGLNTGVQGSLTRISNSGCVGDACVDWTVDIGDPGDKPRGLAIDREGFVWVGTYTGRQLHRVHPETGEVVGTYDIDDRVYGLAIDSEGIMWVATIDTTGIGAFDTNTLRYLGSWRHESCNSPYGIAVDGVGNVWAGGWDCSGLTRLDRSRFDEGIVTVHRYEHPNLRQTRGVAVDGNGDVYVTASGTDRLGKFDPELDDWAWTIETCRTPIGVGVASDGNIWVMCQGANQAVRYDPDGIELDTVATGNGPYSYSDMTGFQLRNFTAPAGTWRVTFDCGYPGCGFDAISYTSAEPAGTAVRVRARTRPAEPPDAAWSDWSPVFDVSPANISGLVPQGRYCEVEVALTTNDNDVTPVVRAVELEWQRP